MGVGARTGSGRISGDHPQPGRNRLHVFGSETRHGTELVIDLNTVGLHRCAVARVDHRRNPIGRTVGDAATAGRVAGCTERIGRRCGVRAGDAEERVQVRAAGLTRIDDQVVEPHVRHRARGPESAVAVQCDLGGRHDVERRDTDRRRRDLADVDVERIGQRLERRRRIRRGRYRQHLHRCHPIDGGDGDSLPFACLHAARCRIGSEKVADALPVHPWAHP